MRIELKPGEKIEVGLDETDGVFTISFCTEKPNHVQVMADMPDDSGRSGIIYEENFGRTDPKLDPGVDVATKSSI